MAKNGKENRKKEKKKKGKRKGHYGDWRGVIVAYESAGLPSGALEGEWEVVGGWFKSGDWMWAKMKITKSKKGLFNRGVLLRSAPASPLYCLYRLSLEAGRSCRSNDALLSPPPPPPEFCCWLVRRRPYSLVCLFFFAFRFVCLLFQICVLDICIPLFILIEEAVGLGRV